MVITIYTLAKSSRVLSVSILSPGTLENTSDCPSKIVRSVSYKGHDSLRGHVFCVKRGGELMQSALSISGESGVRALSALSASK